MDISDGMYHAHPGGFVLGRIRIEHAYKWRFILCMCLLLTSTMFTDQALSGLPGYALLDIVLLCAGWQHT